MYIKSPYLIVLAALIFFVSCANNNKRLLVLYNPADQNIQLVEQVKQLAAQNKTNVDTTSNVSAVTEDSLKIYTSLYIINLPGDTLNYVQQADLQRFVEAGGGLMIMSNKNDTVLNWPWMSKRANEFARNDSASLSQNFNAGNELDYTKAVTKRVPEENRFVVEVLDTYMYEPMEMVIFKDGRVLYVERRGDIKIFDPKTKKSKTIAKFDVSITGNYEDGILGVTLDPDFDKNNWIYINYSPAGKVA